MLGSSVGKGALCYLNFYSSKSQAQADARHTVYMEVFKDGLSHQTAASINVPTHEGIRERPGSDCLPLFPVTLAVTLVTFLNLSVWPPSL